MDTRAVKATVVTGGNADKHQASMNLVLTNPDGSAAGTVKKQAAQVDSTASTVAGVVTDLNALLAKLRAAGILS